MPATLETLQHQYEELGSFEKLFSEYHSALSQSRGGIVWRRCVFDEAWGQRRVRTEPHISVISDDDATEKMRENVPIAPLL